jgi:hypothetical protein
MGPLPLPSTSFQFIIQLSPFHSTVWSELLKKRKDHDYYYCHYYITTTTTATTYTTAKLRILQREWNDRNHSVSYMFSCRWQLNNVMLLCGNSVQKKWYVLRNTSLAVYLLNISLFGFQGTNVKPIITVNNRNVGSRCRHDADSTYTTCGQMPPRRCLWWGTVPTERFKIPFINKMKCCVAISK